MNECFALMKFKESFFESKSCFCNHKLASWKLEALAAVFSGLFTSKGSTSPIITSNYSEIPSELGYLSELTHLILSTSVFSGRIPSRILKLSKLSSLDLSMNSHPYFGTNLLKLERDQFSLARNLTRLEKLHLSRVNISSPLPENLANLSSLTSFNVKGCRISGGLPTRMFQLPKLVYLNLRCNPFLVGHLPEFHSSSPLRALLLSGSSLFDKLPVSIGELAC
ncbi:LOW QUALITY PROTEIN: LRR domain containing protein [Parasponia andersonii]|uniref:LRR domain containing protein n=1 Tax=Parasponia andersonii TaxID=3476 RepID=A0A2P5A6S4_PARAD|nr:LOW QUALITY PROTEIN: LRR domain containing protein [Parasponia andersonii]